MVTTIILICAFAAGFALLLFLSLKNRKGTTSLKKKSKRKSVPQSIPGHSDPSEKPYKGVEPGLNIFLESYPVLKDIPYSPVQEGILLMSADTIDKGIKKSIDERFSSFKPIHANSIKLLNLLKSPETNPGEITSIVSTNPVFSGKVLKSVNSVYYGMPQKINSVGRAITLLGYNNVRSLVLEDSLQNIIPKDKRIDAEMYTKIWVHSAIVSVCAGHLGKRLFHLSEYDCATMGLLHDIGKYFIHTLDHIKEADPSLPLIALEEMLYGINHSLLGSFVAEKWQLPPLISGTIAYHHHPVFSPLQDIPAEYLKHSFVICLADLMGKILDHEVSRDDLLPIRDEYYQALRVSNDLSEMVTPALIKEVEKARFTIEAYISTTGGAEKPA